MGGLSLGMGMRWVDHLLEDPAGAGVQILANVDQHSTPMKVGSRVGKHLHLTPNLIQIEPCIDGVRAELRTLATQ